MAARKRPAQGESRDSISAQLGYLTHAVESLTDSNAQLHQFLRDHMSKEEETYESLDARIDAIEQRLATAQGAWKVMLSVGSTVGAVIATILTIAINKVF